MYKKLLFNCMMFILPISVTLYAFPKVVVIEKTGHRKPPIKFNHQAHIEKYNTECIDCHHKGTNKKCSTCHKKRDVGNVINLKGAYHQQCHDCHRKTKGPRSCGRCHVEK